jgi:hypothetical protein
VRQVAKKIHHFEFNTVKNAGTEVTMYVTKGKRRLKFVNGKHVETEDLSDQNTLTQSELTRNGTSLKRAGKRHSDRRKWRGEEQTADFARAVWSNGGMDVNERSKITKPEDWRGTRSPEKTSAKLEGDVDPHGIKDEFWRAT